MKLNAQGTSKIYFLLLYLHSGFDIRKENQTTFFRKKSPIKRNEIEKLIEFEINKQWYK